MSVIAFRKPRRHLEDTSQICLIRYLYNVYYGPHRISEVIFHIPNGGKRNPREARRLKMMGVRAGVSDLFLPIPIRNYRGAFFELKAGENKETASQVAFGKLVYEFGYYKTTHWEWITCAQDIVGYLRAGSLPVRAPEL